MKVSSRMRDGVMIVSVLGRVLLPRTDVLGAWIQAEIGDRWAGRVLLDFTHVTYINSAGLREVLQVARRMTKHRGRFALCGLSEEVARAFTVVGFDRILDIHGSADEALAALLRSPVPGD